MIIEFIRKFFHKKTIEHHPNYTCKGLCHKDMRCIDLPGHEKVCSSKEIVLPEETREFLKKEVKRVIDDEWAEHVKKVLSSNEKELKNQPVSRQCC